MNLGDIELGDLAAVCAALAVYMDKCVGGRGSRPPLGKSVYVWLGKKLLGIDSFGGRWTLRENWRSIWTSNGFDPSTRKVEQPESFELAVRKLTLRKERLNEIKDERRAKRNGESAETDQPDTEASSARNQDDAAAPMLRQIQRRLGPKQGKLKPLAASLNRPPQPPDAVQPTKAPEPKKPEPLPDFNPWPKPGADAYPWVGTPDPVNRGFGPPVPCSEDLSHFDEEYAATRKKLLF